MYWLDRCQKQDHRVMRDHSMTFYIHVCVHTPDAHKHVNIKAPINDTDMCESWCDCVMLLCYCVVVLWLPCAGKAKANTDIVGTRDSGLVNASPARSKRWTQTGSDQPPNMQTWASTVHKHPRENVKHRNNMEIWDFDSFCCILLVFARFVDILMFFIVFANLRHLLEISATFSESPPPSFKLRHQLSTKTQKRAKITKIY